ncbi:hypothetical protein ACIGXM_10835 [Kitasatospora sp. NPDC052896]|uniref:hypothetical protein n=1 Tax=Kitasatospora sp. NPDC052896 TaxID=3364061 RepID=UPI0037C62DC4
MRIGLASYPAPVDLRHFYPALSLYRVGAVFPVEDFERAANRYLRGNPFFSRFRLVERRFDSVEDFPLSAFQAFVNDEYTERSNSFLLASITYADRPDTQGIFTAFPMPMQDGYRCFLFHQALMKSLKTGRDEFGIAETLAALEVDADGLAQCVPETVGTPAGVRDDMRLLPFETRERAVPAAKVDRYLDDIRQRFLDRSCENLIVIKNALYESTLTLGNFLMFLHVPREDVVRSSGREIRMNYHARQDEFNHHVRSLESPDELSEAGGRIIRGIHERRHRFVVNNYGDVSGHDGSDCAPDRALLVKYQWHMPNVVLHTMTGEGAGADWTVTIRGDAFRFSSF